MHRNRLEAKPNATLAHRQHTCRLASKCVRTASEGSVRLGDGLKNTGGDASLPVSERVLGLPAAYQVLIDKLSGLREDSANGGGTRSTPLATG